MLSELTHLYRSALLESVRLSCDTESRLSQLRSNCEHIWWPGVSWHSVPMDLSTFRREYLSCRYFFLSKSRLDSMWEAPMISFLRLSTLLTFLLSWEATSSLVGTPGSVTLLVTQYSRVSPSPTRSWSRPWLTFLFHEVRPGKISSAITTMSQLIALLAHWGKHFNKHLTENTFLAYLDVNSWLLTISVTRFSCLYYYESRVYKSFL